MIATTYEATWLQVDRPQPVTDNKIESLIKEIISGRFDADVTDNVYINFKEKMTKWLLESNLNDLKGLEKFTRTDIIIGCTQFIDNLYMQCQPQVLAGDYRYHERLGNNYTYPGKLKEGVPLIIAMPFPQVGAPHPNMEEILNEAKNKNIDVHVDGAWVTCCRGVVFDFSHPSIKSVGISLSKGLGLGWNRIGLRWSKESKADSISIMNDFHMNNRALAMIGLHFLKNLEPDYMWKTHGKRYLKICQDFNLTPTNSIYLALRNGQPVGVSPLIRYLENANIS